MSDLEDALLLIPENYSHGNDANAQYQIDYSVALGLLARTHLYARNWQKAYDYASDALAINSYLMNENEYKSGFNDYTNKEWMWGLSCTIDDNMPCYLFYFKDCTSDAYTNLNADPYFKEEFEEGDYRKDLFDWGQTAYGDWAMLNKKFIFKDLDNMLADLVLMRTSEMYLIKAEAAAHLAGKESEAQQLLKTLRDARMKEGKTAAAVTETGDALIQEIWKERRKELWGEGFALTDLIRNQQSVERKEYDGKITVGDKEISVKGHTIISLPDNTPFVPNSKYYLFRIPEKEELQNTGLYSKYPRLSIYDL
ncbi:RagB/SusD family nutrient uptake outer membrane protein [Bacteroides congonensis]|uniref:RagB/SusD family nutrient uptake outer membrane protein n=1 Tax=Bacteroides congonensis TaxID=1871006 RepID=UPI0025A450BD|nr:RagB/SusD family nutrient uptake outer membrane protein [Bacteroides congonensis]